MRISIAIGWTLRCLGTRHSVTSTHTYLLGTCTLTVDRYLPQNLLKTVMVCRDSLMIFLEIAAVRLLANSNDVLSPYR